MQWFSFTKVEKVMSKLQNGWIRTVQRCGWSSRSSRRPETPLTDQARQKTKCPLPSTHQKHEGKAATKSSPKLQSLGHRRLCEQIHHAPGVEGRSGGEAFQNAMSPGAYGQSCCHEGSKVKGSCPGYSRRHAAEPRVHGREKIRHPAGGKPAKWPSLGFLVIHREKDRHQTP